MYVYWIHRIEQNIKTDGYVGVTKDYKQRWKEHSWQSSKSRHLKHAIKHYDDLVYEVIFEGSEEGCYQLEEYFRPTPSVGWNIRAGGGNAVKLSQESKEKISKACSGVNHRNYGKSLPENTKQKISSTLKGRILSPEWIEKMKNTRKGQMMGDNNPRARKVLHIETGIVYQTLTQAALALDVDIAKITVICQGKRKSTKGCSFKYHQDTHEFN